MSVEIETNEEQSVDDSNFPIVGIGASAGGLEALQILVEQISPDTEAAYVVVQHLSPNHESIMDQLLGAKATLPVAMIEDGAEVEPKRIYVNPPGHEMTVEGRTFRLHGRPPSSVRQAPIDRFFVSLADSHGRNCCCVVLSGTGTDGTEGLKAVKAAGGFAIVQESGNARFPGMPNSAAATGVVDFVLRASDIPARLEELIRHRSQHDVEAEREALHAEIVARLPEFIELLGKRHSVSFSGYKPGTLVRRIERRMGLLRLRSVDSFLDRLENDAQEIERLVQDFMIGVTRFFRDPSIFKTLREKVIVPLVGRRPDAIRVWVPGCSTGEEAYTVAMLLLEAMRDIDTRIPLQVFGTDIDMAALVHAREGFYGAGAAMNLPDALLQRYFRQEDGNWRATPILREVCVFAPHNVIQDPPYSRLDLITCRNMLIYMSSELQKKIIPRFHFALKPGGNLLLGPAEGLAGEDDLFIRIDKDARLFGRNDKASVHYTPLADSMPRRRKEVAPSSSRMPPPRTMGLDREQSRERQAERAYLAAHAKPFALVTAKGAVGYLSEAMSRFARPSKGEPSARIEAFLASELRLPVRRAMEEATETGGSASITDVVVSDDSGQRLFDVTASPVGDGTGSLLVVLDPVRLREGDLTTSDPDVRNAEGVFMLERELSSVREQFAQLSEEFEQSNQEANSSHEELLSMNEELQSSNEELETSREELQSINEELETVNAELGENNRQLMRANSDLQNLFESTDLATLFLDPQLSVRSFTPATTRLFGIKNRDVGRSIRDLSSRIDYPELEEDAEYVQRTLQTVEREVTVERTDETFILRMRPYRTTDDRLDGFVLAFYDITNRKRNEVQLARNERDLARQYGELETLYDTTPVGLSLVDKELRWLRINRQLADINGFSVEEHIGKKQDELIPDIDGKIAETQREVLRTGEPIGGFRVEGYTPKDPDRLRHWIVDYYPVFSDGEVFACGTCVREVTEEYALTRELAESEARLRQTVTQSPIHFVQTDVDGHIVWAQGGLPGLPTSDNRGTRFGDGWNEAVKDLIVERTKSLEGAGVPQTFDIVLETAEGMRTYAALLDKFEGDPSGKSYVFVLGDMTEQRALQERQEVLLAELQHRVKNTLATISAVSRFLLAGSDSAQAYQERLDQRLRAIARSHDLLTAADWKGSTLEDIVGMEAAPYVDRDGERIMVNVGNAVRSPRQAVSLGMALHELMTNAAKYGALSTQDGRVEITTQDGEDGAETLIWKERGGPSVEQPEGEAGFGTFLIERVLAADLQGQTKIEFEPDGVRCSIELPAPSSGDMMDPYR